MYKALQENNLNCYPSSGQVKKHKFFNTNAEIIDRKKEKTQSICHAL
jgi:hypothetical protein